MENTNYFEIATRKKFRFDSKKGLLSAEELWELKLESLDEIAQSLNRKVKEGSEESFIGKKTKQNTEDSQKLELVKQIIKVKLDEKELAENRAAKLQQVQQLESLLAQKTNEELQGKSKDELATILADLKKDL